MKLARRSAYDPVPNELAHALEGKRSRGERVIDLTESNPTRAGVPYDERAILAAFTKPRALRYEPEPFGVASARSIIAGELSADASRVVLTASTSEAYAFLFAAFCDAGDEVLAPAPSYPLFAQLAALADVRLVPYRLRYDGAWHVDLESLRAAKTSRTRLILAVSPNNPTGSRLTKSELFAMEALDLPIACDEVFASYMFRRRDEHVVCAAKHATRSPIFSLGGLSKHVALPQMKLAWMLVGGPDALAAPALDRLAWIADAYLSLSTPVQHALPELLTAGRSTHDAIAQRTKANLATLDAILRDTAGTRLDLDGGWYATVRVPRVRSEMETCMRLLERGVYVHPGAFFGFEDEAYVVVSLLAREAELGEGATVLAEEIRRAT